MKIGTRTAKVGDEVRVKNTFKDGGETFVKGQHGRIAEIDGYDVGIRWENWTHGHSLSRDTSATDGWYFPHSSGKHLSFVRPPKSPKKSSKTRRL